MDDRGRPSYDGGRNIAMKVPPHQWGQTVALHRDTLGLSELVNPFGSGRSRSASCSAPTGCGSTV
jgi:hypothetical protein